MRFIGWLLVSASLVACAQTPQAGGARTLSSHGNHSQAELTREPTGGDPSPAPTCESSLARARSEDPNAAIAALMRVRGRCSSAWLPLSALLRERAEDGDLEEASRLAREALQRAPTRERAPAYEALALAWWAMDGPSEERAVLACRQALEADPRRAATYNTCGVIVTSRGRIPEGVALFERAHSLDDSFVPALVNHARIALEHRDYPTALDLYTRAHALVPEDAEVTRGLELAQSGPSAPP